MFEHLTNIETAFGHVKRFSLVLSIGAVLLALGAIFLSYRFQQAASERVYILLDGKVMEAVAGSRQDNLKVEAREHVIRFHDRFFGLSPDEELIHHQLSEALYLGDGSIKNAYQVLREQGYYDRLVTGNVSQKLLLDSIALEMDSGPYRFWFYGRLQIVRSTSRLTRSLITTGVLREITRSNHNPHGLLIEKWETLENKDLKIEKR
ncbi:conjugative transposon protein TraK [Echinicola rosea]|uniref:Conjugative transposon protein TraK n=1 Tax=Echinicola rosea TaxID=1807691 RepID=A0ABQ1V8A7_9BACT|nr:conjugative transposon protein TraK [Echinicola rosea]GGF42675.1 conjugative transposon protein TraK [Echinicola rosea]